MSHEENQGWLPGKSLSRFSYPEEEIAGVAVQHLFMIRAFFQQRLPAPGAVGQFLVSREGDSFVDLFSVHLFQQINRLRLTRIQEKSLPKTWRKGNQVFVELNPYDQKEVLTRRAAYNISGSGTHFGAIAAAIRTAFHLAPFRQIDTFQ